MKRLLETMVIFMFSGAIAFGAPKSEIVVLTQNQYLGADLSGLLTAPDARALNDAALAILSQVAANNFPERAMKLAAEIAERQPHLVALQEVLDFKLNGQNGASPFRDHLADTMTALTTLGARYVVAASVRNADFLVPIDITGDLVADITVGVTDRDVILARADVGGSIAAVPFSGICAVPSSDGGPGCNYQTTALVRRGFVGVDATVAGREYRFINTHLEVEEPVLGNPLSRAVQAAQAFELIQLLTTTTPPGRALLVAGDINSSAEDQIIPGPTAIVPPYLQFVAAGFMDMWLLRPADLPGFTCCQQADLRNHLSTLGERIDVIFSAQLPNKSKVRVLGDSVSDKTRPSRLWPSDHGAVVAELEFQ